MDAISSATAVAAPRPTVTRIAEPAPAPVPTTSVVAEPPSVSTPASGDGAAAPDAKPGPRAHGVLRKLEAGGFHPVAELRHRIRLADELDAARQDRGRDALESGANAIVGSVRDALAGAVESGAVSSTDAVGLAEALDGALQATLAPYLDGSAAIDAAALADDLAGVASGFAARATSLVPDAPVVPTAAPAAASVADLLAGAFDAAVTALLDRIDTLLAPAPAPAPPANHGAAYARFAALYAAPGAGVDVSG